jgi:hypothetical protein
VPFAEVERQARETRNRPLWTVPASWWDPGVAVRMAEWIDRNVPADQQADFIYGR